MSELFCKKFAEWIYKTIGEKIDNDFYTAISDRDIELVYILKRDPEWLADRFSELCKKDEPDYNEEIKGMLRNFKIHEGMVKFRKARDEHKKDPYNTTGELQSKEEY